MAQQDRTKITVEIHNRPYTIVGTEPESHVRLVANLVDQKMKEILAKNKFLDTASLAVLTAINTSSDYLKLKEDYAKLLGSIRHIKDK